MECDRDLAFLENTNLYREFQAEREEILKHKWLESEKAGYDIGFERALTDWMFKHRLKWRRRRKELHKKESSVN
ncbi:MAG: DUF4032 domain-containing protein [Verrucomicrobia bacterium]|nr:DUF4032 domain-containing protein [Verrucomicrobiota bacterium]MCF7709320.1 DUF4032 domain-containing protein [Verrucomicrobiota bacterium]